MALDAAAALSSASSASSSTSAASSTAAAKQTLSSSYTMFLQLLTTQLQNQDPLSPTDSTTFTQQLVQYSQVEQQIKTNDNLTSLIDTTKAGSNSNVALLSYLDKYVEVKGNSFVLQDKSANLTYQLASAAANVKLEIVDNTDTTVATFTGPTGAGVQKIAWDGKNNSSQQLPDGKYTLKVTATDASGAAIAVQSQTMLGKVTGVQRSSSGTSLNVGTMSVSDGDIINVYNNPADKLT